MKPYFILLMLLLPYIVSAQDADSNGVLVFEDPRIALIVHKPEARPFSGKVRGYRVQVYNGNDRQQANQIKIDFLRKYPDKRAYLTYHKPQFRVRIGDFVSRKAALEFSQQIAGAYTIMIVPDMVTILPSKHKREND